VGLSSSKPKEGCVPEFKEKKRGKKACVITNGCPENRIDGARMQEFLRENGWIVTANYADADVILFNACGFTQRTQENSITITNLIQAKKKPSAELIVYGCLPKINRPRLREVHKGCVFGHEIEQLCGIIETQTSPPSVWRTSPQDTYANYLIAPTLVPLARKWRVPHFKNIVSLMSITELLTKPYCKRLSQKANIFGPNTFCIKVSTGCLNACAFCAIRISRGKLKSKPTGKIIEEFEEGLSKGYREFALLGTDVGSYGRDRGTTLVALLRELVKKKGDYEIKVRNIQPRHLIEMMPELREIFKYDKIPYVSSAAESGNNRILKIMGRGYRIEDYKQAIRTLNSQFPQMQIRTQIMVGFPSETEDEFQDTLRLLDEVRFDFVEVYAFQARPNTEAAKMKDQVPQKVIRRRYHKAYMKSLFHL